ncbi:intracellular short-chain-length polyhydroxyalkanoate depolymerase [Ornithinibacillus halophilus]|nr:alpha/beta hydrolase [Ornithinibacillus halophilus]
MVDVSLKKVMLPNGEEMAYRERSGGEDIVVLVHGNMTSSVHWDLVIENLSDNYKVYAVDLRGFGESSYNEKITSIKDFSDDLKAWVDHLGLSNFTLVGWSLGGTVCQQFCADYPGFSERLFLLASGSSRGYAYYATKDDGMPDLNMRIETLDEIMNDKKRLLVQSAYDTKNYDLLKQTWDMLIYQREKPEDERYQKYLEDMTAQRNLAECYQALNIFNISNAYNGLVEGEDKVKEIDVPVCIAWGEHDIVVTKAMTEELREDFGDKAVYKELKGCGHSPLIDDLDQLLQVMEEFFSEVESAR